MTKSVLLLNSYHYRRGGADVVYLETGELLEGAGWRTMHFAMRHPENEPSPWSEYFVEEIEFGRTGGFGQTLRAASKVVWSFEAQRKVSALVRAERPAVAHAHCVYHHLSPSVFPALKSLGVPTIMTAHDLKIACPAYKMLSGGEVCERCRGGRVWNVVRRSCIHGSRAASALIAVESALHKSIGVYRRHVDWVIAPSLFYRDKLAEWGYPAEKIVHIPNYVDAARFGPPGPPGRGVAYFGRLAPEKGLATLIAAAALSGVEVTLIGSGPAEERLRALAARAAAPVVFAGRLSGEALWDRVRAARAVALPSEWYENAPMSVLEAYALGKPVIGADIGGIPELVIAGETGWMFPSGDAGALASRLTAAETAPDTVIADMGAAARARLADGFRRDDHLGALSDLYARAVRGAGSAGADVRFKGLPLGDTRIF